MESEKDILNELRLTRAYEEALIKACDYYIDITNFTKYAARLIRLQKNKQNSGGGESFVSAASSAAAKIDYDGQMVVIDYPNYPLSPPLLLEGFGGGAKRQHCFSSSEDIAAAAAKKSFLSKNSYVTIFPQHSNPLPNKMYNNIYGTSMAIFILCKAIILFEKDAANKIFPAAAPSCFPKSEPSVYEIYDTIRHYLAIGGADESIQQRSAEINSTICKTMPISRVARCVCHALLFYGNNMQNLEDIVEQRMTKEMRALTRAFYYFFQFIGCYHLAMPVMTPHNLIRLTLPDLESEGSVFSSVKYIPKEMTLRVSENSGSVKKCLILASGSTETFGKQPYRYNYPRLEYHIYNGQMFYPLPRWSHIGASIIRKLLFKNDDDLKKPHSCFDTRGGGSNNGNIPQKRLSFIIKKYAVLWQSEKRIELLSCCNECSTASENIGGLTLKSLIMTQNLLCNVFGLADNTKGCGGEMKFLFPLQQYNSSGGGGNNRCCIESQANRFNPNPFRLFFEISEDALRRIQMQSACSLYFKRIQSDVSNVFMAPILMRNYIEAIRKTDHRLMFSVMECILEMVGSSGAYGKRGATLNHLLRTTTAAQSLEVVQYYGLLHGIINAIGLIQCYRALIMPYSRIADIRTISATAAAESDPADAAESSKKEAAADKSGGSGFPPSPPSARRKHNIENSDGDYSNNSRQSKEIISGFSHKSNNIYSAIRAFVLFNEPHVISVDALEKMVEAFDKIVCGYMRFQYQAKILHALYYTLQILKMSGDFSGGGVSSSLPLCNNCSKIFAQKWIVHSADGSGGKYMRIPYNNNEVDSLYYAAVSHRLLEESASETEQPAASKYYYNGTMMNDLFIEKTACQCCKHFVSMVGGEKNSKSPSPPLLLEAKYFQNRQEIQRVAAGAAANYQKIMPPVCAIYELIVHHSNGGGISFGGSKQTLDLFCSIRLLSEMQNAATAALQLSSGGGGMSNFSGGSGCIPFPERLGNYTKLCALEDPLMDANFFSKSIGGSGGAKEKNVNCAPNFYSKAAYRGGALAGEATFLSVLAYMEVLLYFPAEGVNVDIALQQVMLSQKYYTSADSADLLNTAAANPFISTHEDEKKDIIEAKKLSYAFNKTGNSEQLYRGAITPQILKRFCPETFIPAALKNEISKRQEAFYLGKRRFQNEVFPVFEDCRFETDETLLGEKLGKPSGGNYSGKESIGCSSGSENDGNASPNSRTAFSHRNGGSDSGSASSRTSFNYAAAIFGNENNNQQRKRSKKYTPSEEDASAKESNSDSSGGGKNQPFYYYDNVQPKDSCSNEPNGNTRTKTAAAKSEKNSAAACTSESASRIAATIQQQQKRNLSLARKSSSNNYCKDAAADYTIITNSQLFYALDPSNAIRYICAKKLVSEHTIRSSREFAKFSSGDEYISSSGGGAFGSDGGGMNTYSATAAIMDMDLG